MDSPGASVEPLSNPADGVPSGRSRTRARRRPLRLGVAAIAALALLLAGCGSDDDGGTAAADCETIAPTDGVTEVTVVGKNLKFDVECIEVEPGPVHITFDNQDSSVAHNLHVTGHGVNEATELKPGKNTQDITVDLTEPGQYTYSCDPHASMEGKIVVVDPAASSSTTAAG